MKYILHLVASGDTPEAVQAEARVVLARAVVDATPRQSVSGHRGSTASVTWQILTSTDEGDDTTELRSVE